MQHAVAAWSSHDYDRRENYIDDYNYYGGDIDSWFSVNDTDVEFYLRNP